MDNDRYNGAFTPAGFKRLMQRCAPWRDKCRFVIAPDVVGDARATLAEFPRWYGIISDYGYPVAFATQDGATVDDIPWGWITALFVGGTDNHKLGHEARVLIAEAKRRQKWVHIGRVNSLQRAIYCNALNADSIDGTTEAFEPARAVKQWTVWLAMLNQQMRLPI